MRSFSFSKTGRKMDKSKYRILMLAPNFYPAYGAECLVNAKLAIAMLNKGWDIKIISHIDKEYSFFDASESSLWRRLDSVSYPVKAPEAKNSKACIGKLMVVFKTQHITNGMLWVNKCIEVAEQLFHECKFDVIISRAIPEYSHLAAMYLSKKYNVPWIANWNDPVPNTKFPPPGGFGADAPLKLHTRRFLKAAFSNADWHTFPSERLKQYISGYMGVKIDSKSSIIPHIALNDFATNEREAPDKFILCHTGALHVNTRNPYYLLYPFSQVLKSKRIAQNSEVHFIGNIPDEIRKAAQELSIERNVKAEYWSSYESAQLALQRASVSVVIEEDVAEGIYLPSKLSDYVQVGNPILAIGPREGTVRDYLFKEGGGIYSYCKNAHEVCNALEQLYKLWEERLLTKKLNLQNLSHSFSENTVTSLYSQLFSHLPFR